MGFTAKQVLALKRALDHRHVRTREAHGKALSYIEGWYAISEANRIFGFDGWSRETIDSKCVLARENRGSFTVVYTARVRITVQADGATVIREGHGTGEGRGSSPGEVHDIALKVAETDATKRALATFGRPFGLALYGNRKAADAASRAPASSMASPSIALSEPEPVGQPQPHADRAAHALASNSASKPAAKSPAPAANLAVNPFASTAAAADQQRVSPDRVNLDRPSFARDDTTAIPRPSRYYGRQRYLATRDMPPWNLAPGQSPEPAAHPLSKTTVPGDPSIVPSDPELFPGRIDKSVLTLAEPKRLRDKNHLRFVAAQPCLICGRQPSDPHHLRFAQPRAIGLKVSDEFTVPLCRSHHSQLHRAGNEVAWWEDLDVNALEIAKGLWEESHGWAAPISPPIIDAGPPVAPDVGGGSTSGTSGASPTDGDTSTGKADRSQADGDTSTGKASRSHADGGTSAGKADRSYPDDSQIVGDAATLPAKS
jgi:DNA recombination protein Rad52